MRDNYTDKFSSEKITPDLVGKLSLSDFRELGVQNRNEVMKLRMECSKYGPTFYKSLQTHTIVLPYNYLETQNITPLLTLWLPRSNISLTCKLSIS